MLISELISNLEVIKEKHGDIPCYLYEDKSMDTYTCVDNLEVDDVKCNLICEHEGLLIY